MYRIYHGQSITNYKNFQYYVVLEGHLNTHELCFSVGRYSVRFDRDIDCNTIACSILFIILSANMVHTHLINFSVFDFLY